MKRWIIFETSRAWAAKCKRCQRVATSKSDLSSCPRGCEKTEESEEKKKKAAKAKPVAGDLFDAGFERRD